LIFVGNIQEQDDYTYITRQLLLKVKPDSTHIQMIKDGLSKYLNVTNL